MGGNQSKSFPNHKWSFKFHQDKNYDIYQNQKGQLAQRHIVQNNPIFKQEDQIQIYHYRLESDKPIVKSLNAKYSESLGICSAQQNIQVYTQYIQHRLSQVKNLNYGQCLYVLSEALAGFQQLFGRVGSFVVRQNMIGFNYYGQVRVWLNENFASNHIEKDTIVLMSTQNPKDFDKLMLQRQQQDMVQDIWLAVSQHAQQNVFPAIFRQYTNNFKQIGFIQARKKIYEAIQQDSLYVPNKLNFKPLINDQQSKQYGSKYED